MVEKDNLKDRVRLLRLAIVTAAVTVLSVIIQSASFVSGGFGLDAGANAWVSYSCSLFILVSVSVLLWQYLKDLRRQSHLAYVDELTGLANRRQFTARFNKELANACQHGNKIALLYLDLDRFKHINDSYGHEAGDAVICAFAERVSGVLRQEDFVARLAGDEFAAVISSVSKAGDIARVGQRIFDALAAPVQFQDKQIYIGVSIGAALLRDEMITVETALAQADFALLQAKDSGRNTIRLFDPQMAETIRMRGMMESDLREAILNDRFELHYQPLYSRETKSIIGVEALARWNHPEHGPVMPSLFIGIAEEIGMIDMLGEKVLRRACNDTRDLTGLKLAVNVSPLQFLQDSFAVTVSKTLRETGFEPERLELEITENAFIRDAEKTREMIAELREIGVRIALDDFGTGFSTMSYLRDYPLDRIKIDRSFTAEINHSGNSLQLVSHMIELGKSLGMSVTVEGVENEQQMELLKTKSYSELQGYFFSKPVTAQDLGALLEVTSKPAPEDAPHPVRNIRLAG